MQVHCKHWYHLSTLRVSGQAKITFGENEVPFQDRCAEAGRPDSWTVRSEIIWCDFPKRSAYNATAFGNRQKNDLLINLGGQYGGNLICLPGLKKFMLPCPCRSLSWEQTSSDFDLFIFLYISMNVLNHQRLSELGHYRSIYSLYFMASLSLCSSQCEYQSWNFRQQCKKPVVFKSGCSFNWKTRYILFCSHLNWKLEYLWMLDGHFFLVSTQLQVQNE